MKKKVICRKRSDWDIASSIKNDGFDKTEIETELFSDFDMPESERVKISIYDRLSKTPAGFIKWQYFTVRDANILLTEIINVVTEKREINTWVELYHETKLNRKSFTTLIETYKTNEHFLSLLDDLENLMKYNKIKAKKATPNDYKMIDSLESETGFNSVSQQADYMPHKIVIELPS